MYSFLFFPKQDVEDFIGRLCQAFFGIDKELLNPAVAGGFFAVNFDNRFNPSAFIQICGEFPRKLLVIGLLRIVPYRLCPPVVIQLLRYRYFLYGTRCLRFHRGRRFLGFVFVGVQFFIYFAVDFLCLFFPLIGIPHGFLAVMDGILVQYCNQRDVIFYTFAVSRALQILADFTPALLHFQQVSASKMDWKKG